MSTNNPLAVVAFAGPAGCGKDTAGAHLIEKYGFKRLSFATPLKSMLAAIGFPEPPTQSEKEAIIPWIGVSWRKLGQTLGTEWGRNCIDPDLWVKVAERLMRQEGGAFVITDLRFENEAALVRAVNGVVCFIEGRAAPMAADTATHISEVGINALETDHHVDNSGTLEALHTQLDGIVGFVGVSGSPIQAAPAPVAAPAPAPTDAPAPTPAPAPVEAAPAPTEAPVAAPAPTEAPVAAPAPTAPPSTEAPAA